MTSSPPTTTAPDLRTVLGTLSRFMWLVPLHAALLIWGTWEHQPDPTTELGRWSGFVSTDRFLVNHLVVSILGQTLAVMGIAALVAVAVVAGARPGRALTGATLHVIGSGLMIAGFGVAAFGQPAIAELWRTDHDLAAAAYDDVYSPVAFVVLLLGAFSFAISTIWTATALRPLAVVPAWARRTYAASGPLFAIIGIAVGPVQTAAAVLMTVSSLAIVAGLSRTVAR